MHAARHLARKPIHSADRRRGWRFGLDSSEKAATCRGARGERTESPAGECVLNTRLWPNLHQRSNYLPTAYTLKFNTDHGGAFSPLSVCVTLIKRACTGRKVATVVAGEPLPSATGALHVFPSIDTCTR